MSAYWTNQRTDIGSSQPVPAHTLDGDIVIATCIAAASQGDVNALFDLGIAFSTGSHGVSCDLIEAHKWFNLSASRGHEAAQQCRADIADEMSARDIAEAQRRARAWLADNARRAA